MNVGSLQGWSHLPLQYFRLQAERSSTVVTFQLDCAVCGGQRCLSIGGCLKSSILFEKKQQQVLNMHAFINILMVNPNTSPASARPTSSSLHVFGITEKFIL